MLINKETWPQDKPWVNFILAAYVILTGSYFFYEWSFSGLVHGGTWPGIVYGSLAFALMIFDALLGMRKRIPGWRVGRASTWLRAHVWLSLLLFPLVFFHSAFRIGGHFTLVLWILFFVVMLSGVLGIILQNYLPQMMMDQVAMETIYDQIDHVTNQLRYDADVKIMQVAGKLDVDVIVPEGIPVVKVKEVPEGPGMSELKSAYLRSLRPLFASNLKIRKVLRTRDDIADIVLALKPTIPANFHAVLDELVPMIDEKRQLELQKVLHHWMHGWLFVHVPVSFALLLLTLIHSITALWY